MNLYWYAYLEEKGLLLMRENAFYGMADGQEIISLAQKLFYGSKQDVPAESFVPALTSALAMRYLDINETPLKNFSSLTEVESFFDIVDVESAAANFFNGAQVSKIALNYALDENLILKQVSQQFNDRKLLVLPRDRFELASGKVSGTLPGVVSSRLRRVALKQNAMEGYLRKGYDLA